MGLYIPTPNYRLHYHRDGATGFRIDPANNLSQLSSANLATLNNESDDYVELAGNPQKIGIWWPYLVDLTHYFVSQTTTPDAITPGILETSADTTNGQNGTWTTRVNPWLISNISRPDYRSSIDAVAAATGIVAVRFTAASVNGATPSAGWANIHLYGKPAAGAADFLRLWHPTLDEELAADAFYEAANEGDPAQGGSYDATFRVKNTHPTLNAVDVIVQTEGRQGSTAHAAWLTYSQGGVFSGSQSIGNLAPGAISSVLTGRLALPADAALNLGSPSTIAIANSWT